MCVRSVVAALLVLALALATAHAGSGPRITPPRCLSANGAETCGLIQTRPATSVPESCKAKPAIAALVMATPARPERPSRQVILFPTRTPVHEADADSPWKPPPHRA